MRRRCLQQCVRGTTDAVIGPQAWNSRSGSRKATCCSSSASILGTATEAEMAVAPKSASTAARTASLDGNSNRTGSVLGSTERCANA